MVISPVHSMRPMRRSVSRKISVLYCELRFVGNVLVIAAAANAEVRAGRRDALGRWLDHPLQSRTNEFLLLLDGLGRNGSPGSTKGTKTVAPS